jgi:hypothetical protein
VCRCIARTCNNLPGACSSPQVPEKRLSAARVLPCCRVVELHLTFLIKSLMFGIKRHRAASATKKLGNLHFRKSPVPHRAIHNRVRGIDLQRCLCDCEDICLIRCNHKHSVRSRARYHVNIKNELKANTFWISARDQASDRADAYIFE